MRQELLYEIKKMIPIMKSMVDDELAITIWDRTATVLHFEAAKTFPLHFDIGFTIPDKNDKIFTAMNTGKTIHNSVPKEVFGVSIEGNLVPIFDNGEVVGCVTCVYSVEEKELASQRAEQMTKTLEESRKNIVQILDNAQNATSYIKDIHKFVEELDQSFKGVISVLNEIKGNAARTKILALNASIESARAGQAGVGFNIVAKEMSRLSEMDAQAASKIETHLSNITQSMSIVKKTIQELEDASDNDSGEIDKIISKLS